MTNSASAQAAAITNEAATASANYVKYVTGRRASGSTTCCRNTETNRNLFAQYDVVQTMGQVLTNAENLRAADARQWQKH